MLVLLPPPNIPGTDLALPSKTTAFLNSSTAGLRLLLSALCRRFFFFSFLTNSNNSS